MLAKSINEFGSVFVTDLGHCGNFKFFLEDGCNGDIASGFSSYSWDMYVAKVSGNEIEFLGIVFYAAALWQLWVFFKENEQYRCYVECD